jgi:hypothetical protein
MEYYLELKLNELSSHKNTQRKLTCILLSEGTQPEKVIFDDSNYITIWKRQ